MTPHPLADSRVWTCPTQRRESSRLSNPSLRKRLARLTRSWRNPPRSKEARISVVPAPDRISELEARLARLDAGWRQHIPQLLDSVSSLEHRVSLPKPADAPETPQPTAIVATPATSDPDLINRVARAEAQLETLRNGWDAHLPAILESLSKVSGDAGLAEEAHYRIDAVRRDLDRATARLDAGLSSIRLSHVTLTSSSDTPGSNELRLHIRNGGPALAEHFAVDLAVGGAIPSEPEAATSIVVASSVDFGPDDDHAKALLDRLLILLAPRGIIHIQRRSLEDIFNAVESGVLNARQARDMLGLNHQLAPSAHTTVNLKSLMVEAGFKNVRIVPDSEGIGSVITATRVLENEA